MGSEAIHFVLELTEGLIVIGLGGLFTFLLRNESRITRLEVRVEELIRRMGAEEARDD